MEASIASFAYLVAAICFILGIRGLASPETARQGNWIAIAGMAIAIGATLLRPQIATFELVLGGIVIGGAIGTVVALRVKITDLPQLVAIFNSLVGLAAVLIAAAALQSPSLYGIPIGNGLATDSLVEIMASTAIGAVTFTGSVVAFAKLQGLMPSAPSCCAAAITALRNVKCRSPAMPAQRPRTRPRTRPATASSFAAIAGSRASGAVMTACSRAVWHPSLQAPVRAPSSRAASLTSARPWPAFASSTPMMFSTDTESWSGCQQSKSVTIATVA